MRESSNPLARYYAKPYYDQQRAYTRNLRYPIARLLAGVLMRRVSLGTVLDVGCAKGYLVEAFCDLGIEARGLDISDYAIQSSAASIRPLLRVCDIEHDVFPFHDRSIDLVTAIECMEHLRNPSKAVEEIARVLAPGGYAAIASPKITFQRRLFQRLYPNPVLHPSELTRDQWTAMFASYGMTYVCDFTGGADQEWRQQYRATLRAMALPLPPQIAVGRLLARCGRLGNHVRALLNNWVWQPEFMLFKKEGGWPNEDLFGDPLL